MSRVRASEIIRKILPWALETNLDKPLYRTNYKGNRGRIGIVGGARDYAGAPYFASMAAMRIGADLAYVICSRDASQAIKNYSPDLIVTPLLDHPSESEFATEMDGLLSRLDALVIGPGLGRDKLLQFRAKKLIEGAKARSLPLILDADSLILINEDPSIVKDYSNVLLTPNRRELQRMLEAFYAPKTFNLRDMADEDKEELVKLYSRNLNVSILAKGPRDIICHPESFSLSTEPLSGSNRRCGGQGDILAGLAGVYLHWIEQSNRGENCDKIKHPVAWAAYLAAVTTRNCNELAYKEFRTGMLTSNMLDKLHLSLELLLGERQQEEKVDRSDKMNLLGDIKYVGSFTRDEINRYRRQMIMEEFGPKRQTKIKGASAIIIGAGGLGCPAAVYLGAGGMGRLGIVDDDRVEASNLHRQILHNVHKIGMLKTESIKEAVLAINPNCQIVTHSVRMSRDNAVELIEDYDMVIDATDNLRTRYMINDACVVAKKPLISGAALKMDGQLTVYNYDEETPCFRCLFPEPPPPGAVGSCSDNGVLGVIPGIIGVQLALEALKIGAGLRPAYAGKMLLFDGQIGLFRHATLSKRKVDCVACGSNSKLGRSLIDYDSFCGQQVCQRDPTTRGPADISSDSISVTQYLDILQSGEPHVLVDVRPADHSTVSRLANAIQIPVVKLIEHPESSLQAIEQELDMKQANMVIVVCRRGIASKKGMRVIRELFKTVEGKPDVIVKDITGGMTAWADLDPNYSCI